MRQIRNQRKPSLSRIFHASYTTNIQDFLNLNVAKSILSLEATYIKKNLGSISVLEAFSLPKTHKKTLSNDTRGVIT